MLNYNSTCPKTRIQCTRSKRAGSPPDELDDKGNLLNLIDYDCDAEFDRELLNKELDRLSRGTHNFSSKLKKTIKSKKVKFKLKN